MRMGVVSDDLTGANDIGIMFAKSGLLTEVYVFEQLGVSDIGLMFAQAGFLTEVEAPERGDFTNSQADICILDTNTRLDEARVVYDENFAAARALLEAGCAQFYSKTSSAFVGNVGAQFDGMLDALNENFAVVVVGFPKNGRTTVDGVHYVHGKKLEDSEFRNDPIHPMTRSSLIEILQAQTQRKVALVNHEIIAQGAEALGAAIEQMRKECHYLVLDVVDQAALQTIARVVCRERVLCGSSALAEELTIVWGISTPAQVQSAREANLPPHDRQGILCAAGSVMPQTIAQIEHLRERGASVFEMNTLALLQKNSRPVEVTRLTDALTCRLDHGQEVVIHSPNRPEKVEETRAEGAKRGLSRVEVSHLISDSIAQVVANVHRRSNVRRLIVAGGETSAAVCEHLRLKAFRVWKEIQPGVPSCVSLSTPSLLLVLKSGSFGSPDFFERAVRHLKEQ